jgi:hypothetical protein
MSSLIINPDKTLFDLIHFSNELNKSFLSPCVIVVKASYKF